MQRMLVVVTVNGMVSDVESSRRLAFQLPESSVSNNDRIYQKWLLGRPLPSRPALSQLTTTSGSGIRQAAAPIQAPRSP
jgi:hypothetical protein